MTWSVVANPKLGGTCRPDRSSRTEPPARWKGQPREAAPVPIGVLKEWEEMRDFQIKPG